MSFAVIIKHLQADRESELCRVGSQEAANRIANELRSHRFIMKEPDQKRGARVPRYASVRIEERP